MFDDLFKDLGTQLNEIISSQVFQVGVRAVGVYIVLVWLAAAFWAYRDMQHRSSNPVAPYLAAALMIVFTPVFFIFGILLYRIVRPRETITEANERALAEEAMLAEVESRPHCANCSRPVHEDWIICPTCRNRLRRVCPNCSKLVELDWSICAWCGKDFERPEAAGAPYMPPVRGRAPAPSLAGAEPSAAPPPGTPAPLPPGTPAPVPYMPQTQIMPAPPRASRSAAQPLAGER